MSLQKKYVRKSISFLTPQNRKILPSQQRLSFSIDEQKTENLLSNLLNDPIKRALLMEVLSQDELKKKKTPKFKFESPTALCRRRALERMQEKSDSSDSSSNKPQQSKKVPFERILKGITAYVEIRSNDKDRSAGVKALMQAMGADVKDTLTRDVTHVVFKDGSFKTYQKAKLLKAHVVSVLWIEAVRKNEFQVPEKDYPAVGARLNANVSNICEKFCTDYKDVLQEEINRSKPNKTRTSNISNIGYPDDIIDTSQTYDIKSGCVAKNNSVIKNGSLTPNSLYLNSSPDMTSDSDSEQCRRNISKVHTKGSQVRKEERKNPKYTPNKIAQNNDSDNQSFNFRQKSQEEELSSLKISIESDKNVHTPQRMLTYENVTQRKKKPQSIDIIHQHIIPAKEALRQIDFNKELQHSKDASNLVKKQILKTPEKFDNALVKHNISKNIENGKSTKKAKKRLYNVKDIDAYEDEQENANDDGIHKNSSNVFMDNGIMNIESQQAHSNINHKRMENSTSVKQDGSKTPNKPKQILNIHKALTTPRRRSTRLLNEVSYKQYKDVCDFTPTRKKVRNMLSNEASSSDEFVHNTKQNLDKHSPNNKVNDSLCFLEVENPSSNRVSNMKTGVTSKKMSSTNLSCNIVSPQKIYPINSIENRLSTEDSNKNLSVMGNNIPIESNSIDSNDEFISNDTAGKQKSHVLNTESVCLSNQTISKTPKKCKQLSSIKSRISPRKSIRLIERGTVQEKAKQRRSTMDFMPKQVRIDKTPRNKMVKKASIVCTRFHNTEVQVFEQIVKKLGVFFVEDEVSEKTTHLVAAEPRRTINLLRAIARGCWIVKSEWVYRSLEANRWLPEEDYELCEFSDAVQKARHERQAFGTRFSMDIFKNCGRIYISTGSNPRCSDLQELIILCKGTVTARIHDADIIVGEYIQDKPCVAVNWILDSISFYKKKSLRNYLIDSPTND